MGAVENLKKRTPAMLLTAEQRDALTELINIAFSRTAAALSEITSRRVLISAPQLGVHPLGELQDALAVLIPGEVATVHQIFTGNIAGDALLVLNYEGATQLVDLLADERSPAGRLDPSGREVLMEVGNILLNACLGMFGNVLEVQVSFSVPRLRLEDLRGMLTDMLIGGDDIRVALVVYTTFRLKDSDIGGFLVLILGVSSLERLLAAVGEWAARTGDE